MACDLIVSAADKHMIKTTTKAFIGIAITFTIICCALCLLGYDPDRPFDAALWRADTSGDLRCKMYNALVDRMLVKGKTSQEVLAILGEPNRRRGDRDWLYDVRDPEWSFGRAVIVGFDPNGIAEFVGIDYPDSLLSR